MKITPNRAPAAIVLLISFTAPAAQAGVFDLDFESLYQQTDINGFLSASVDLNAFTTLSAGQVDTDPAQPLQMSDTDPFGSGTLFSIAMTPNKAVFAFDTGLVNVTSVSVSGSSNNVDVVVEAFDQTLTSLDKVTSDASWSSTSTLIGDHIARVEILGLETAIMGFRAEFEELSNSNVPVPGSSWLLTAGILSLFGLRRRPPRR